MGLEFPSSSSKPARNDDEHVRDQEGSIHIAHGHNEDDDSSESSNSEESVNDEDHKESTMNVHENLVSHAGDDTEWQTVGRKSRSPVRISN